MSQPRVKCELTIQVRNLTVILITKGLKDIEFVYTTTVMIFLSVDMFIGSRRSLMSKNQEFTYSEVVGITDNFKTVIGEGGFGKVYLGTLKNDNRVAVKLRSSSSNQGFKEFRSEVRYSNPVTFSTACKL